jgi:hypothetical protein
MGCGILIPPFVKIGRECGRLVPIPELDRKRGDPDFIVQTFFGQTQAIHDSLRETGVYIIGLPGTGKSTLAERMAIQDIRRGKGMAFLDPHGRSALHILDYIPKDRLEGTIYFEPKEYPFELDLLEAQNDDEINELASDVYNMFVRMAAGDIGPQMGSILKFALHAMIHAKRKLPQISFMNLEDFLKKSDNYREQCLPHVSSSRIKDFWRIEYGDFKNKDSANAILRRMTDIRLSPELPQIFGDKEAGPIGPLLNLQNIMDAGKILIVNLGKLTPESRRVLGTCLLTKLTMVLPRRATENPFYLYVDEFDEFAASPYQYIINKCRKFQICLTIMNQALYLIKQEDNRRAIKAIDTKVIFRVDDDDARALKFHITPFEHEHATKLRTVKNKFSDAFFHSPLTGTHLIRTTPLPPAEVSHRETILEHLRAAILENMRKLRDGRSGETPPVCSTGKDGKRSPPPEGIALGGAAKVPPHGGEKKNS